MIRSLLRSIGVWPYLKYYKKEYFPSDSQKSEDRLIPERISFYSQFVKKGDICFDIGANIGNRTDIFVRLGAEVVAVEPQKECAKFLKIRFGKRIKLVNCALSEKEGESMIYISETSEISSLSKDWIEAVSKSRFRGMQWNRTEQVKTLTLDNLIERFGMPAFCKIDVEGYEEEVVRGLSKAIPMISFEYTIPERFESMAGTLNALARIGTYECNYTVGETMLLESENWISKEELLSTLHQLSNRPLFGDVYIRFVN